MGENQRRSPVLPEKVSVFHNKPAAPSRLPDISEYRFSPTEPVNFLPKVSQEKFQFHLHKLSITAGLTSSHAVAFQEEKLRPKPEQYTELLDARIQIRPTFREKLIEQLKGTFGEYYDYHYRDIATHEVDDLNMEDPYSFSHRTWELEYQRKQELQKKHPVQSRQKSHNTEL